METVQSDTKYIGDRGKLALFGLLGEKIRPSNAVEMDQAIAKLSNRKDTWARLPVQDRIRLLDALIRDYSGLCDRWVELGIAAKQAQGDAYAEGLEWGGGPMAILRYMRRIRLTLESINHNGKPPLPVGVIIRPNGQVAARVYPTNLYERLTTPGTTAEVWMDPGLSVDELSHSQATAYKEEERGGKVCLVLGSGNVSGCPVNDTLSKLFVENQVVLLKMSPVNEYLGPLIERGLRALISEGYLRVVYGSAAEGSYLCSQPGIDAIHMTGSDKTYEAIVFGSGTKGQRRKKQQERLSVKPFTSELGNVAPAIIVPGPWNHADVSYQAEQLASHLCDNASYSCSRTRMIVQHSSWHLRHDFLHMIQTVLSLIPPRFAYYPGAVEQYDQFLSAHPEAKLYGLRQGGKLPWALISGLDPNTEGEICFKKESFCPIIAETALEASSAADFIDRAVDFANRRLWGTLTATIIVHPRSLENTAVSSALDRALENLRYGVIAVNCTPGLAWAMTVPPWGSFPNNSPWNIQSGTGFVHNSFMFSRPQKTVLRAPFRTWPHPVWFPSRATSFSKVTRKIVKYEREPSWWLVPGILWAGLR